MKSAPRATPSTASDQVIEVFFDGDCPLCRREIAFLLRRDSQGRIIATDIAEDSFDASVYGRSHTDFMATIQARLDDRWIRGVEVFRQLYSAVGFKRMVRLSRVRPIAWVLDHAYTVFAKHRLRLTGRCTTSACSIPSASERGTSVQASEARPAEEAHNTASERPDQSAQNSQQLSSFLPSLPPRSLQRSDRTFN